MNTDDSLSRGAHNEFHNVAFQPPEHDFPPHFLDIVAEVKAAEPPHVLKAWLGVSKGMLPVKYIRFNKACFCVSQISLRSQG